MGLSLSSANARDSRRHFERELRSIGRRTNALMAELRGLRRDLDDDVFFEGTESSRALIVGATEQMAQSVVSLEAARERLP